MAKEEIEKCEQDWLQEEEKLAQKQKHLQVLSEEYAIASRVTSVCFEEVTFLFRESSDWAYYQNLVEQHSEQERRFHMSLQDSIDSQVHRQRQIDQQRLALKERLKRKGEH